MRNRRLILKQKRAGRRFFPPITITFTEPVSLSFRDFMNEWISFCRPVPLELDVGREVYPVGVVDPDFEPVQMIGDFTITYAPTFTPSPAGDNDAQTPAT